MSKLVLVQFLATPDQLVLLVPDHYNEEDVYEVANKNDPGEIEIREARLTPETVAALTDIGIKEWREYWG